MTGRIWCLPTVGFFHFKLGVIIPDSGLGKMSFLLKMVAL